MDGAGEARLNNGDIGMYSIAVAEGVTGSEGFKKIVCIGIFL